MDTPAVVLQPSAWEIITSLALVVIALGSFAITGFTVWWRWREAHPKPILDLASMKPTEVYDGEPVKFLLSLHLSNPGNTPIHIIDALPVVSDPSRAEKDRLKLHPWRSLAAVARVEGTPTHANWETAYTLHPHSIGKPEVELFVSPDWQREQFPIGTSHQLHIDVTCFASGRKRVVRYKGRMEARRETDSWRTKFDSLTSWHLLEPLEELLSVDASGDDAPASPSAPLD